MSPSASDSTSCSPTSDKESQQQVQSLEGARETYTYAHSHAYEFGGKQFVLQPIAVLKVDDEHPFPSIEGLNGVQIIELVTRVVELAGNLIVKVTNLFGLGEVPKYGDDTVADPVDAKGSGRDRLRELGSDLAQGVEELRRNADRALGLGGETGELYEISTAPGAIETQVGRSLQSVISKILALLAEAAGREAGLFGPAASIDDYAELFQTFPVPDVASNYRDDQAFARMRVAGPNPMVIARIDALPAGFPVSSESFQRVMGSDDSLSAAGTEGRLYIADYVALNVMVPGDAGGQQKFIEAPLALFAVPRAGSANRELRPVAIQCGQENGNGTPVFYPDDGTLWQLAKLHVQVADGNYHELISHLGLTHLLIEPFVVTTHRQLPLAHSLFKLLIPHFQGTLFINNAAITSLINPGGTVDKILAGTIESDWKVTTEALGGLDFDEARLPNELIARGVEDPARLPDYPYRDDALLVWDAIEGWVKDYLELYYANDAAVAGDVDLRNWYAELVSKDGGGVKGFGETDAAGAVGIFTFDYLVQSLTMIIFTSSAQHAAVNFPQRSVMSYTPAMPLAAYGPAPTHTEIAPPESAELEQLPPLQQAVLQQLVGQALGGVYFGRLGEYDRHEAAPYFTDPKVSAPLRSFQSALRLVEARIGGRNLARPLYDPLLPSRIPQSINI